MRRGWWKEYLPNTSARLSLVSLDAHDRPDTRAHWPMRITQLVGGRRWSLAILWHRTPDPVITRGGTVEAALRTLHQPIRVPGIPGTTLGPFTRCSCTRGLEFAKCPTARVLTRAFEVE